MKQPFRQTVIIILHQNHHLILNHIYFREIPEKVNQIRPPFPINLNNKLIFVKKKPHNTIFSELFKNFLKNWFLQNGRIKLLADRIESRTLPIASGAGRFLT